MRTAYRAAAAEGQVYGVQTDRYWWEHSTPERYREGVSNVLSGQVDLPYAENHLRGVHPEALVDRTATIVKPVWVGAGARIGAGATVGPHVQLGQRAVVESGVQVRRAVVWDGSTVSRDVEDEVVVLDAAKG